MPCLKYISSLPAFDDIESEYFSAMLNESQHLKKYIDLLNVFPVP